MIILQTVRMSMLSSGAHLHIQMLLTVLLHLIYEEMRTYIGINILMGIAQLPEGRDYWSYDQILHDHYIPKRFSRNCFEMPSRYLHISNPTTPDATDKWYKVRSFLNKLEDKFHTSYTLGPNVSVDEAMIQFDGRLGWKHSIFTLEKTVSKVWDYD